MASEGCGRLSRRWELLAGCLSSASGAAGARLPCLFGWILAAGAPAAEATTQAFSYTGGEQTFLVPSGVSSIHALVRGGHGGVGGGAGGAAAEVSADFGVTPGQVLYVEVGGNGESSEAGGEGGFNGGASGNGSGAGGGGGASDIRLLPRSAGLSSDTRWIVAAGGGGGGGTGSDPGANGGDAGSMGGISLAGNEGGSPGTETEGGAGGSGCGGLGTSGQLGLGGAGGSGEIGVNGGGGGGGGLYGGGGGAGGCTSGAGGGGGGSSLVPPGGALSLATASAAPLVEITYTLPPTSPPATPVPPTAIAPNTLLGSHPARRVKTGKKRANVRFTFSSDVAGATFRCKLDKGTYAPCASPKRFKVKPGKHKFSVEAVKGGLADTTPATFSFKVIKTS